MKVAQEVQTTPYKPVETIKTKDEGENNMENGSSLNATEIAVGSLLAGRGGYGYGGGAWGGAGGYAPFAGPASNAVRINRNADLTRLSLDRVSDQAEETRRILQAQNTADQIMDGFNRVCDRQVDSEFRTSDRLRDIEREIAANARLTTAELSGIKLQSCQDKADILTAVKDCCCETQKLVISENSRTREEFQRSLLEECRSRADRLETVNAITQACGCCPPQG